MTSSKDQILRALKTLRPQIERLEESRKDLYARQWELCIKGDALGLKATEMARAMKPSGDITNLAEAARQHIREAKS